MATTIKVYLAILLLTLLYIVYHLVPTGNKEEVTLVVPNTQTQVIQSDTHAETREPLTGGTIVGASPTYGKEASALPTDGTEAGVSPTDGKEAGVSPTDGTEAGVSPTDGTEAGVSSTDSKEAGVSPTDGTEAGADSPKILTSSVHTGKLSAADKPLAENTRDYLSTHDDSMVGSDDFTDIPDLLRQSDGTHMFDYNDEVFSYKDLEKHREEYEELFRGFPNYQNSSKMLAYKCKNFSCGGLGDRLKGIVEVYMLSLLSKRRFVLIMKDPSDLEHFLVPNMLDWRLTDEEMKSESYEKLSLSGSDYKTLHDATAVEYEMFDYNPEQIFTADLAYVIANQDWTRSLRKLSVTPYLFKQLYKYPSSDLMRIIYHGLFKPSKALQTLVDDFFRNNVKGHKLACLHARMGEEQYQRYKFEQIMTPLTFLKKQFSTKDFKIMVATDDLTVRNFSSMYFPNLVDTSYLGDVKHIDYMRTESQVSSIKDAAFMHTMVDHMILTRCDVLVLTNSGFGVSAAALRHTSHGLYVFQNGDTARVVAPTRRDLLREMFQWRCHAQINNGRYICDG